VNQKPLFLLLVTAGLAAGCSAQIVKSKGGGYSFRVKYTKGQTIKFDSSISMDNKGTSKSGLVVRLPITISVLNVAKGIATVNVAMGAGTIGTSSSPVVLPQSVNIQLDDRNRSGTAKDTTAVGPAMPDHPVKIGSTWTAVRPITLPGGVLKRLDAVYTFAGPHSVNGKQVAVVNYRLSGPADGSGTMMLLASDGSLFSNETLITVPSMSAISRLHISMKRRP